MAVYGIANLTITDRSSYELYTPKFMPILRQYGGTLLVADDQPKILEGEWTAEKVIVVSFEDEASFHAWYGSPEYQAIIDHRLGGATGPLLLAQDVGRRP